MSEFSLPATTWDELKIIITSYSKLKREVSNEDVAKMAGLSSTKISRNNKFLVDNGLIEGGKNKKSTELCDKLGRAILHERTSDIKKYLRQVIERNENIAELISSLRIQGEKDKEEFAAHILYFSNQTDTQYTKAGSKCIIDILLESDFIYEENGVLKITQSNNIIDVEEDHTILESIDESELPNNSAPKLVNDLTCYDNRPAIAINIQLQLPESDNPEVYENLFKSLRKNLIDD